MLSAKKGLNDHWISMELAARQMAIIVQILTLFATNCMMHSFAKSCYYICLWKRKVQYLLPKISTLRPILNRLTYELVFTDRFQYYVPFFADISNCWHEALKLLALTARVIGRLVCISEIRGLKLRTWCIATCVCSHFWNVVERYLFLRSQTEQPLRPSSHSRWQKWSVLSLSFLRTPKWWHMESAPRLIWWILFRSQEVSGSNFGTDVGHGEIIRDILEYPHPSTVYGTRNRPQQLLSMFIPD